VSSNSDAKQPRRVRLLQIEGAGEFAGYYVLDEDLFTPGYQVQCDEVAGWIYQGCRVDDFVNVGVSNTVISTDKLPEFFLIESKQRLRD
jgi:hypothetical protein